MRRISTFHYLFFLGTVSLFSVMVAEVEQELPQKTVMQEHNPETDIVTALNDTDAESISTLQDIPAERFLINEVAIKVEGPERNRYITKLELRLPDFDGKVPDPERMIDDELMYQDALGHKVPVPELARKHVENIKSQNKISDQQFDVICAQAGLDPQSALEKFEVMGGASTMMDHITSRIFLSFHEVEAYYKEHPVTKEPKYQLRSAFVSYTTAKPLAEQKKALEASLTMNKQQLEWGDPFWLKRSDIADDKENIIAMAVGDISICPGDTGFEVIELVTKKEERIVPLEKLYKQVAYELRIPKMQESLDSYKKELRAGASVVYLKQ